MVNGIVAYSIYRVQSPKILFGFDVYTVSRLFMCFFVGCVALLVIGPTIGMQNDDPNVDGRWGVLYCRVLSVGVEGGNPLVFPLSLLLLWYGIVIVVAFPPLVEKKYAILAPVLLNDSLGFR